MVEKLSESAAWETWHSLARLLPGGVTEITLAMLVGVTALVTERFATKCVFFSPHVDKPFVLASVSQRSQYSVELLHCHCSSGSPQHSSR